MPKVFNAMFLFIVIVSFSACKKSSPTPPAPTYNNFKINAVTIGQISYSTSWDIGSDPDVYFNIEDASGAILYDGSTTYITDVPSSQLPFVWTLPTPYIVPNTATTYYVAIYDADTPFSADDLIGKVAFKIDDLKSGYLTTTTITSGTNSISFTGTWY